MYKSFHYWVIDNLKPGSTILELGSGPGTNILLNYFNVYSVEHDHKWVAHTKSNYIHAPICQYTHGDTPYNWYNIEVLEERLPFSYDLIIVDGPTGKIGRLGFFYNLELFNLSVPILIDDVNRKADFTLLTKVSHELRPYTIFSQVDKKFGII